MVVFQPYRRAEKLKTQFFGGVGGWILLAWIYLNFSSETKKISICFSLDSILIHI